VAQQRGRVVGFGEATAGTVVAVYVDPGQFAEVSTLNARDFYERAGFRKISRSSVRRNHVDVPVVLMEYDAGEQQT